MKVRQIFGSEPKPEAHLKNVRRTFASYYTAALVITFAFSMLTAVSSADLLTDRCFSINETMGIYQNIFFMIYFRFY